ncbi:hypothetical protein, variant [Aphanomyces astaci]|uniref:RRM domain-containing protein n=1 Tax=Aphanomyces astaci TaxID=112090 RepID=W4GFH5_APHAT|nr:hypothetical protein H257_08647 [Aphanomyces astaci]XP_009832925.1 hypothetical protein, variant [Aphanomyces astaci]ETV77814.1 hypothetical protein H257_08647 [Aphanomyces astaci]ETV77815.1 hypothetical protein, variant [Aphanomyces astaci]|eukprot:XP_009832924.1 hypothetical protein H257_08647 [Aphanomyces astaci]
MSQANKVFVGNLSDKVKESDIRDKFEKFGKILEISIKTPSRPPSFAFVQYEDVRDAEDAVRELNGTELDGNTLRVEITKRGPRGEDPRDMERDERSRRQHGTSYRISVSGLSSDTSWQDLKDFLRDAGDVAHAEVDRRGHGTASFQTADQMDRAIRKLDDEELKGRRVRIREDYERSRGRSRSRSRSRSPPRRRRRRSPSRSRTPPRRSRRSDSRSPPRRRRSRS